MTDITFGLNANNDMFVGTDGNLAIFSGAQAVAQNCKSAMQCQQGELVLSLAEGLPNLNDVWLQQNFPQWEVAARQALLNVPGVVQLISFSYQVEGDTLSYQAVIQTAYGQLPVANNMPMTVPPIQPPSNGTTYTDNGTIYVD